MGIADTMAVSCEGKATVSGVLLDTMIYSIFVYLLTAVAILFSCNRGCPLQWTAPYTICLAFKAYIFCGMPVLRQA